MVKAGGGRAPYLGGINAQRLASRWILFSMGDSAGSSMISRDTRFREARGRRAEKGPRAGRSRLGSRGMVNMQSMRSCSERGRRSRWDKGAVRRVAIGPRVGEDLAAGTGCRV